MAKETGGAVKLGGEAPPAVKTPSAAPVHEARALGQPIHLAGRLTRTVAWPAIRQATPEEIDTAVKA